MLSTNNSFSNFFFDQKNGYLFWRVSLSKKKNERGEVEKEKKTRRRAGKNRAAPSFVDNGEKKKRQSTLCFDVVLSLHPLFFFSLLPLR